MPFVESIKDKGCQIVKADDMECNALSRYLKGAACSDSVAGAERVAEQEASTSAFLSFAAVPGPAVELCCASDSD